MAKAQDHSKTDLWPSQQHGSLRTQGQHTVGKYVQNDKYSVKQLSCGAGLEVNCPPTSDATTSVMKEQVVLQGKEHSVRRPTVTSYSAIEQLVDFEEIPCLSENQSPLLQNRDHFPCLVQIPQNQN